MSAATTLAKMAPVAKSLWDDDDFQDELREALFRGRAAYGKKKKGAPPPTVVERGGEFVAQLGRAVAAGGQAQETRRKSRRRKLVLGLGLVGAAAAGAAYLAQSGGDEPTPNPTTTQVS